MGDDSNGIEAIASIKKLKPDCALVNLSMPGANGLEVFAEAKRWSPKTRFAIITGIPSSAIFHQLMEAGVDGIFLKNSDPQEICDGLADILQGRQIVSADAKKVLDNANRKSELTSREVEVLQGVARGLSNAKIADQLGVSHKTIDSHRTSLMRKMGVHSKATLLVEAMKQDLSTSKFNPPSPRHFAATPNDEPKTCPGKLG